MSEKDSERDENAEWERGRRRRSADKKRTADEKQRQQERERRATLLIENSSVLAILIKSWKSLARSIGQTGKVRSVGSPFGNGHSQRAHFTLFPPFAPALFQLFEIFESIVAEETQINHISYKWFRNIYYFSNETLCQVWSYTERKAWL